MISSLILPDIVLLLAYLFGVYLFSKGETEYLFILASHVSVVEWVNVWESACVVTLPPPLQVFIKNSESGNVSYNKRLITTVM